MTRTASPFFDELAAFDAMAEAPLRGRTGRPPAPPEERTEPFSLRLTIDERVLVMRAAAAAGAATPAGWAREALLEAARSCTPEAEG